MVSKQFTMLSMLLPVAMVIGSSTTIYTYKHSYDLVTFISYILGFSMVIIFLIVTLVNNKKR
jgi:hypothetical protein